MRRALDLTRPVGGKWKYTQPETGVKFEENHHRAFLMKIRDHRMAVGLSLHGGWTDEVWDTVCRENPLLPQEEIGQVHRYYTPDDVQRFMETMLELNKHGELVSEDEHKRRINICAVCPKNGSVGGGCKWCEWMARKTTELIGGRPIHRVAEIAKRSCLACGCDLLSKTAVPLAVLKQVDEKLGETPDYAPGCWMIEDSP